MEKSLELLTSLAERVGKQAMVETAKKMGMSEKSSTFENLSLENFVQDENARAVIQEFELDKPENFVRFAVEAFFGAFESVCNSVDNLKKMQVNGKISQIYAAKEKIDIGLANPKFKDDKLSVAQNQLTDVVQALEEYIKTMIESIRDIDNQPRWKFFIKAVTTPLKTIDTNMACIKASLMAIEDAMYLHILVANELGMDISTSVIRGYQSFIEKHLLEGDTLRLLEAYETEENRKEQYYLSLPTRTEQKIREFMSTYSQYTQEYTDDFDDDEEISFE